MEERMKALTKGLFVFAAVGCGFSTAAHADDGTYLGTSTVQNTGPNAAICAPHEVKLTVTEGRFSYGTGGAPLAVGTVAPDGTFTANYSGAESARRAPVIQNTITGHIRNGSVSGTSSSSGGCVQDWTLTKQQ
jgi:hypothetical protein